MAGWDSKVIRPDAKLVENIAKDILKKLKEEFSSNLEGLVGIHSRIQEIQELLSVGSQDIRFLGIWGMGGIGKTTLAEVVCKKIATQFEAYCFLEDVRENSEKHGRHHLIKEFLRQVSGESNVNVNVTDIKCYYLGQRMLRKRLLIVVDDVKSSEQLEFFVKNRHLLGVGSRIIVTSRDKHVLLTSVEEAYIYEVKKLYYSEAVRLFSQNAFKNTSVTGHNGIVSGSFIQYADGNPLALKVLGSFLFGKNQAEWRSALERLRKAPNKDIQNVLRISYDSLDQEEKEIFLHVACFFIGKEWNEMIQMLNACGFSTDIGLRALIDKSLIIVRKHHYVQVQMHDLLQELGRGIVHQESREPGGRSRLWNHEDIVRVLKENSGTESIEAIYLHMSKILAIDVIPNIFARTPNLKLLRFSCPQSSKSNKVRLPLGLESFPNGLRYLHWEAYPVNTLPSNFRLMDLVELHLPYSKLIRLPEEIKDFKNLKHLDLSFSDCLIELPELSGAINLTCIKLRGCVRLMSFPSGIGLKSLENIDLSSCSSCSFLEKFLEIPRNIKFLNLNGTAIKQLPSSVELALQLQNLSLKDCTQLKSLPRGIWKLKSLLSLNLTNCPISDIIPEILESMDHSSALDRPILQEQLSSSVENQKSLSFIEELNLTNCSVRSLPASIKQLSRLRKLNINSCRSLVALPDLPLSIEELHMRFNQFETLPASIKLLSRLTLLDIIGCDRLQSLPDLPHSLKRIDAYGCTSLVMVSGLKHLFQLEYENSSYEKMFIFSDCLKLDPKAWREFLSDAELVIQLSATQWHMLRTRDLNKRCDRTMILHPGSETPEWLAYKTEGRSIDIPLETHSNDCRFLGVALCLIINSRDFYWSYAKIRCEGNGIEYVLCDSEFTMQENSDHTFLMYDPHFPFWDFVSGQCASFRFCHLSNSRIMKCGMLPIYVCDEKCKQKCR
ncbi:disease resistance-like protein DSC1 isoform X2 [Euphorbia lathyris]